MTQHSHMASETFKCRAEVIWTVWCLSNVICLGALECKGSGGEEKVKLLKVYQERQVMFTICKHPFDVGYVYYQR